MAVLTHALIMIGVYYRWDTGVHDIHKVKQELSRHCFTNISLQSITVFLLHNAAKYNNIPDYSEGDRHETKSGPVP